MLLLHGEAVVVDSDDEVAVLEVDPRLTCHEESSSKVRHRAIDRVEISK